MAVDLDPVFRQALKLLHSSSSDSAEGIRKYLDELIRQKHGSSRMLVHTLHKKHLAEECRALGSGGNQAKVRRRRSSDKSSVSSDSSASESVRAGQASSVDPIAAESHQSPALANVDDNAIDANIHNALFDDLVCAICRGIDVSAKNRLIECTKCNTLYHQECHSPQIKDAELLNGQELLWHCSDCRTKSKKSLLHSQTIASPHKSNQSPSSSSSNSSTSSISNIISTLSSGSSKRDRDRPKDGDRERESSSGMFVFVFVIRLNPIAARQLTRGQMSARNTTGRA